MTRIFLLVALLCGLPARADEFLDSSSRGAGPNLRSSIAVVNMRSLDFAETFQGDPSETIRPARGGAENSALFLIEGRPYASVIVLIPDDTVILSSDSRESGRKTLRVRGLVSLPEAGLPFTLNAKGLGSVSVGGTREAILNNQAAGSYEGRFFVTVMYQ
ncbi:MAG: DUF4402 domain-containing protein [Bdellovibrionota bacterium]